MHFDNHRCLSQSEQSKSRYYVFHLEIFSFFGNSFLFLLLYFFVVVIFNHFYMLPPSYTSQRDPRICYSTVFFSRLQVIFIPSLAEIAPGIPEYCGTYIQTHPYPIIYIYIYIYIYTS